MGLSITYSLSASGGPDEIRRRMSEWHEQLKRFLPDCRISELSVADDEVSFYLLPGSGSEIARMRLRHETGDLWRGFWDCKTQYAGCAQHGGPENFLKVHGCLIKALDIGCSLGLVESVCDDGGYWTHRSREKLLEQFHIYQEVVGSLVTQVKAAGFSVESPVLSEREPSQRERRMAAIES